MKTKLVSLLIIGCMMTACGGESSAPSYGNSSPGGSVSKPVGTSPISSSNSSGSLVGNSNSGVLIPLRSLHSIQNYRGDTVARYPITEERVVDKNSALLINRALQLVVSQGTAAGLNRQFSPGLGLAGKTGTTDNFRDSWFAGFSENYVAAVWVGLDDNQPAGLTGSRGALRVWADIFSRLDVRSLSIEPPAQIETSWVDRRNGLIHEIVEFKRLNEVRIPDQRAIGYLNIVTRLP